jgi:Tol biopolymer transport system component
MFKIRRTKIIMFITLTLIFFQPLAAGSSIRQMNTTIIADLNQTIDEDIRSLVDTDRLEIERSPFFNVIWSPDEKSALISAQLNVYPKKQGKTQSGYISALYMADKEFMNISRISWTEFTTTNHGKIIESPSWSLSGDHFAYEELTLGKMYSITSAQLSIVSTDLQQVQHIKMDNKMLFNYNYPLNYQWSPVDERIAVPASRELVVYDPVQKTNLAFEIDNDASNIDSLEWSADSKKIVFLENAKDIVSINTDNLKRRIIYSSEDARLYNAGWSPDSTKLVFYDLKGSDENGNAYTDLYILDENTNGTEKINLSKSNYWIVDWYPGSEKLLVIEHSSGSSKLCSISMAGETKVLYGGVELLEGHLGPNNYISVFDPYTYELFVFNEASEQRFLNVTRYSWINNDLLFTTDNKTSIFNESTNTIWEIPISSKYPNYISLSPQQNFIAIDNLILEMNYEKSPSTITRDQVNSTGIQIVALDNNSNYQPQANTTASSHSPGFSAILALIGLVAALIYVHLKKQ